MIIKIFHRNLRRQWGICSCVFGFWHLMEMVIKSRQKQLGQIFYFQGFLLTRHRRVEISSNLSHFPFLPIWRNATWNNLILKIISNIKAVMFSPFKRRSFKLMPHVLEDVSNTNLNLFVSFSLLTTSSLGKSWVSRNFSAIPSFSCFLNVASSLASNAGSFFNWLNSSPTVFYMVGNYQVELDLKL